MQFLHMYLFREGGYDGFVSTILWFRVWAKTLNPSLPNNAKRDPSGKVGSTDYRDHLLPGLGWDVFHDPKP